jgi:hypothetical protein
MITTNLRAEGDMRLRYEDISQEGRIRLDALTASLGVVWRVIGKEPSARDVYRQGIIAILVRFDIEGTPGPFAVDRPLSVTGSFDLGHVVGGAGAVSHLLLDIATDLHGPLGRTNLPPPANAGEVVLAGRVRARHVFTRPFGPPDARKVLSIGPDAWIPPARLEWTPASAILDLPAGARWLTEGFTLDPVPLVLGAVHTDSNQHVNSLVYPRFFEDAVLRALHDMKRPRTVHARRTSVGYRKPGFAGEVLRLAIRLFEGEDGLGAIGAFTDEGERDPARARVCIRTLLA